MLVVYDRCWLLKLPTFRNVVLPSFSTTNIPRRNKASVPCRRRWRSHGTSKRRNYIPVDRVQHDRHLQIQRVHGHLKSGLTDSWCVAKCNSCLRKQKSEGLGYLVEKGTETESLSPHIRRLLTSSIQKTAEELIDKLKLSPFVFPAFHSGT